MVYDVNKYDGNKIEYVYACARTCAPYAKTTHNRDKDL